MFLDYFALVMLFFVALTLFYGLIVIHDIPYEIAKARNHPQQDAIHVAGWISLFTLHAIWPFLWIWATLYREDRGWGFQQEVQHAEHSLTKIHEDLALLNRRLARLEGARGHEAVALDAAPGATGGTGAEPGAAPPSRDLAENPFATPPAKPRAEG